MTDTDRHHLAAILGMLGSDHAGERAAAALQAEAFRRKHGLTWAQMLEEQKTDATNEQMQWAWQQGWEAAVLQVHKDRTQPTPPPPPPPPPPMMEPISAVQRVRDWASVIILVGVPIALLVALFYFRLPAAPHH